jgi:hypothetical protein
MKPSRNDITGDFMLTGATTDAYRDGWDRIFGSKKKEEPKKPEEKTVPPSKRKKEVPPQPRAELPTSAFFMQIVEYERGWGSKPDGYVCFLTQEAAEAYRSKQYAGRSNDVPDYYVNYNDVGWLQIQPSAAEQLVEKGVLYMDDPYKKGQ